MPCPVTMGDYSTVRVGWGTLTEGICHVKLQSVSEKKRIAIRRAESLSTDLTSEQKTAVDRCVRASLISMPPC